MKRCKRAIAALFIGSVFVLTARLFAAAPLHVAVIGPSSEIADQIAAELSQDEHLLIVERSQLDLLLQEAALSQSAGDPETQIRAGHLLGVEAFVHVRALAEGAWQIDVIDGASGKVLASASSSAGKAGIATARNLLESVSSSRRDEGGVRIAVIDFTVPVESEGAAAHATGLRLAAQMRTRLAETGLTILDRTTSAQLGDEHALAESGLTQTPGRIAPLLGADLVINGQWRPTEKTLRLSVLDARKASLAADETFPVGEPPALSEPMLKWLLTHAVGGNEADRYSWAPSIAAEALFPFYQGITLMEQGRPVEAADEFEKAYQLNDKFDEAYLWEARCYDAVGLTQLGEAERRFTQHSLVGWGISSLAADTSTDGITFLGVFDQGGDVGTCRQLEVEVTDAMARASQRVLLPANIAALRDEYDVLVGTKNSRGITWEQAPGFLTRLTVSGLLSTSAGRKVLQLQLRDTVRGNAIGSVDVVVNRDGTAEAERISGATHTLLSAATTAEAAQSAPLAPLPPLADIKARLGHDGNIAILQLALQDPSSLAADLRPLQRKSLWSLSDFLNFGLREYLLAHLPSDCPQRPWLQLEEIGDFLPFEPLGELYSARKMDPIAALQNFAQAHSTDLAGAVADYMLLWETMADIPYPELEKRFGALERRLQADVGNQTVGNLSYLLGMPGHLQQLAIIAQDDPGRRPPLPQDPYPHRVVPNLVAHNKVTLEEKSGWMANEWRFFELSPEDAVQEARAAIAFLGRGRNSFKVDPRWLHDFPHSHALLAFAIEALRKSDQDWGLPLLHPFDATAERAAYREIVDYAFAEMSRWLPLLKTADELDVFESYTLRRFITDLDRPGYRLTVSDADFQRLQAALISEVAQAEQRLGLTQLRRYDRIWLDWRKITRSISSFTDQPDWLNDQVEIYDQSYLAASAERAAAASANTPLFSSRWQQLMRRYEYASLSPRKRADYFLNQLPKVLSDYGNSYLSGGDMEHLFQFALTLLHGGHYAEAETLFQQVHDAPRSDLNRLAASTDLRANAAFQLAALRAAFRPPGGSQPPVQGSIGRSPGSSHQVPA